MSDCSLTTHLKTCLQSEVRTLEEHKEDLLMTVAGLTHYMADADRDSVKLKVTAILLFAVKAILLCISELTSTPKNA